MGGERRMKVRRGKSARPISGCPHNPPYLHPSRRPIPHAGPQISWRPEPCVLGGTSAGVQTGDLWFRCHIVRPLALATRRWATTTFEEDRGGDSTEKRKRGRGAEGRKKNPHPLRKPPPQI